MYNVYFQVHGSPEVHSKFFNMKFLAVAWLDTHYENFSLCWFEEVFH